MRTVRLIGVKPAMEMMLTGRPMRADKALRLGLVDKLVTTNELDAGARELINKKPPTHRPPFAEAVLSWPIVRSFVKPALVAQVASKAKREHYPAPYAIVDLWAQHGASGQQAYESEARSIAHLFTTETARNLIRVFMLQDRLKSMGGKGAPPVQSRACRRRRRDGRRHRRVVRASRPHGDACRIARSNTSSPPSNARTSCSRSA